MSYTPIPITERTQKIKEQYMRLAVPLAKDVHANKRFRQFHTGDKWITLGFLEGWARHADAPSTKLRRAYAEAEELYAARPIILDGELMAGHLYLPEYTKEEQARYDALCERFEMSAFALSNGAKTPSETHIALDLEKLLRLGLNGLRREITEHRNALDLNASHAYPDFEEFERDEFYRACLLELDALSDLARRYADAAEQQAASADGTRRSELLRISHTLRRVPDAPAESFFEAIQSVHFFLSNLFGLYPLGRPDRYLYPFYKRDVEGGALTREEAQELIDQFCLHVSTRVFSRAACGFIVGGKDENGDLTENDLTYMFLTALEHLRLPDPNGALAVTEKTSDEILKYCTELLSKGVTHPAFYNDDLIRTSFVDYGFPTADAANYIHTTCAELSLIGKTKAHTTVPFIFLPVILQETVDRNTDAESPAQLMEHFIAATTAKLQEEHRNYSFKLMEARRSGGNDPYRVSCLIDDCIARGKSIYDGGAKYMLVLPTFVGFANIVDAFVAIKHLVFDEQRLTLAEFNRIVHDNFEGFEDLRQYILHRLPHYGNNDKETNEIAKVLSDGIRALVKRDDLPFSERTIPGTFSYVAHATFGAQNGACFDGHLAHTSWSDGCGPVQGRDVEGPTAMINSLTSWDERAFLGGMVVNVKFASDFLQKKKDDVLIGLLRAFLRRGGIEMQVNVVDKETLRDAREHPHAHENLLVRIGGYSDYFVRLDPSVQEEIINRTEY